MNLEIDVKNHTCYYFNDIMRLEDIDYDNILLDEKSYENILTHDISYKTFASQNHCVLHLIK